MKHWVKIEYQFDGTFDNGYCLEVKTNHYYREDTDSVLHVKWPTCINVVPKSPSWSSGDVLKEVTQKEFNQVLRESIEYMDVNITKHNFIKDAKK